MKKPILIAAATAVLAAFQMNAAPAFPGKQTVTQPDGTTIEVRVVGDERFHTLVTDADALPIGRDADGEYRYRMADGSLSAVAAHNLGERTAAEADFLRANIADISVARLVERQRAINPKRFENAIAARKAKAAARAGAAKAPLADQFTDCPTTGVRRIPVIFVQYTDSNSRAPTRNRPSPPISTREHRADASISLTTPTAYTSPSSTSTAL